MLTFVDVLFTSIVHIQKIKRCSGLQIYCDSRSCPSSCLLAIFLDNFVVELVKCFADCSAIFSFFFTTKTKTSSPGLLG